MDLLVVTASQGTVCLLYHSGCLLHPGPGVLLSNTCLIPKAV
jgi:hypothetical protein